MPRNATLPVRGPRALDLMNFFIADVQTGFGPFIAVYLTVPQVDTGAGVGSGSLP